MKCMLGLPISNLALLDPPPPPAYQSIVRVQRTSAPGLRAMRMEEGETELFEVKLSAVKTGALRMFLGFWVMGQKVRKYRACGYVALFVGYVMLFCRNIGLFCGSVGL